MWQRKIGGEMLLQKNAVACEVLHNCGRIRAAATMLQLESDGINAAA